MLLPPRQQTRVSNTGTVSSLVIVVIYVVSYISIIHQVTISQAAEANIPVEIALINIRVCLLRHLVYRLWEVQHDLIQQRADLVALQLHFWKALTEDPTAGQLGEF